VVLGGFIGATANAPELDKQSPLMTQWRVAAGLAAGSASLQADALDFLGYAGNYAISLFVVSMTLRYRLWRLSPRGQRWACSVCG
jgi:hypothetical protein